MTFDEHMTELRQRFLIITVWVAAVAILGFVSYPHLLKILQDPYCSASPGH